VVSEEPVLCIEKSDKKHNIMLSSEASKILTVMHTADDESH
jgi:hypothetical protein